MKAWVTKYALTVGIEEIEVNAKVTEEGVLTFRSDEGWHVYLSKGDWHHNKEQAVVKAEDMRIRKIKSLDKQIKKLSAISFD